MTLGRHQIWRPKNSMVWSSNSFANQLSAQLGREEMMLRSKKYKIHACVDGIVPLLLAELLHPNAFFQSC